MHNDSVQTHWQQVVQGSLLLRRAINSEKSKEGKARYQEKLQSRTSSLQVDDGAPLSMPSLVLFAVKACQHSATSMLPRPSGCLLRELLAGERSNATWLSLQNDANEGLGAQSCAAEQQSSADGPSTTRRTDILRCATVLQQHRNHCSCFS